MKNQTLTSLLLVLVLGLLINHSFAQQCDGTSCSTCVETPGCGWCSSNLGADLCLEGTPSGPTDISKCRLGEQDDEWYYGSCPDPCSQFGVCSDCQRSGCGYCVKGEIACTSRPGKCDPQFWRPAGSSCELAVDCSEHQRCDDCVQDSQGCQFCPSSKKCYSIDDDEAKCDGAELLTTEDECDAAGSAGNSISWSLSAALISVALVVMTMTSL